MAEKRDYYEVLGVYDYDSTGKKIRSTMYNADGSVDHYTNY